jgi:nucleotide-binding universal stress UspA family protein
MRVLLPVNGTFDATFIIDFVSNHHWPAELEFKILHVCDSDAQAKDTQVEVFQLFDSIAHKITTHLPGCLVNTEIVVGTPIYDIVQQAKEWRADMIVMGYRTGPFIHNYLAGSVSRGVAMQTPCSLVVIRPPEELRADLLLQAEKLEEEKLTK